ncbi:MAG TPA: GNAT family N-acetyltransferase [Paludibacter sp.]|nr:GNAT family N-acetyltransferase [Paludibacter sp.]
MILHRHINEIDPQQWQQLVDKSEMSCFFQTPECYDFYRSLTFLEPFLTGVSEDGELKGIVCGYIVSDGGLFKRYFSRRAIIPGGVLLSPKISVNALHALFAETVSLLRNKAIYIEVRNYNDFSTYRDTIELSGFRYQPHFDIHVPVRDLQSTFQNLSESKRRQINSSRKAGVTWSETTELEDVKAFYKLLRHLYKSKVKTPLFPLEFFEKLVQFPFGKLLVVRCDNRIIGGMACVALQKRIFYEWFVCGEDRAGGRIYPSVVATWAGLEYAAQNGIPTFDFMGAGKPGAAYGVRDFKRKFGGELVEYGRFLYICKPFLYKLGRGMITLLKTFA